MEAIKLCAKNDSNGNPRRIFVVLDKGEIIRTIDEGYYGIGALRQYYPELCGNVPEFETTSAEYRGLLRHVAKN